MTSRPNEFSNRVASNTVDSQDISCDSYPEEPTPRRTIFDDLEEFEDVPKPKD